jgi:hypothetical protein
MNPSERCFKSTRPTQVCLGEYCAPAASLLFHRPITFNYRVVRRDRMAGAEEKKTQKTGHMGSSDRKPTFIGTDPSKRGRLISAV